MTTSIFDAIRVRCTLSVFAMAWAVVGALACTPPTPSTLLSDLDEGSIDLYANYLAPTEDESAWRSIPWLPTFAEGMRVAGEQKRPLLFWAMNGHPLGCT